jgi:hypothetical protein
MMLFMSFPFLGVDGQVRALTAATHELLFSPTFRALSVRQRTQDQPGLCTHYALWNLVGPIGVKFIAGAGRPTSDTPGAIDNQLSGSGTGRSAARKKSDV